MDQEKLEASGVGFRCRGCGISVFGRRNEKLCNACFAAVRTPPNQTEWHCEHCAMDVHVNTDKFMNIPIVESASLPADSMMIVTNEVPKR